MAYTRFDRFIAKQRFLAALPHIQEGSRVCDVGCGVDAAFLNFAAARIAEGWGVDDHVSPTENSRWHLVKGDIQERLPFANQQFDHVVMLAVLEHLKQPKFVLNECFRILAPGGSLILTWPSGVVDPLLHFLHSLGIVSDEMESGQHQKRLPIAELVRMLRDIGFGKIYHKKFELGLNNLLVAHRPAEVSGAHSESEAV
jgi:ubiquinone/menaquinone biosynthesis C-methylase UbiE